MANGIGKISIIKKDFEPGVVSLTNSLRQAGFNRFPGTGRMIFPFKENNGDYRTGLDKDAQYIRNINNKDLRESEQRRVEAMRADIEGELRIDLGPKSKFYNFNSDLQQKVTPYKLGEKDAVFDLSNPWEALTFAWLRVHPAIAPSLEAYNRGDVSADTQYFVNDDEIENKLVFDKKKIINDAIVKLSSLTSEKKKKIARLMDLPYSDNTSEEVVYNGLDDLIKAREMPSGAYKGSLPVGVFNDLVSLSADSLDVRDLVEQAIKQNVYRVVKGKLKEGENVMWQSKDELIDHLLDVKNQVDRLELEKRLQINKLKEV